MLRMLFPQGSLLSVAFMNLNLAHNSVGFYQVKCYTYTGMFYAIHGLSLLSIDIPTPIVIEISLYSFHFDGSIFGLQSNG